MLEMDNLSKQIATTLNEEEIIKEEEAVREAGEGCAQANAVRTIDIPFCCTTNCPQNFIPDANNINLTYDLRCLKTKVEPDCILGGAGIIYKVKVVGCIPFIANVRISTQGPVCQTSIGSAAPDDSLCCGCCVCVDETLCTTGIEWLAFSKAASINFTCSNVTVVNLAGTEIKEGSLVCGIKVSGKFRIILDNNCCPF